MSHVNPVFPKAIFSWSDRVDEVSNVMANDPNSIASDLISVESTLGVMPQVEKTPFNNTTVSYATVDARISDANAGSLRPYAQFNVVPFNVSNGATVVANIGNAPGKANTYIPTWDQYQFYNGTDATVSIGGAYIITAWQEWPWNSAGYVAMHLFLNGAWQNMGRFDWNFPATGPTRWDRTNFNNRQGMTTLTWMGIVEPGWRVQIVSENGTPSPLQKVINGGLRIHCLRKVPLNIP